MPIKPNQTNRNVTRSNDYEGFTPQSLKASELEPHHRISKVLSPAEKGPEHLAGSDITPNSCANYNISEQTTANASSRQILIIAKNNPLINPLSETLWSSTPKAAEQMVNAHTVTQPAQIISNETCLMVGFVWTENREAGWRMKRAKLRFLRLVLQSFLRFSKYLSYSQLMTVYLPIICLEAIGA